MLKQQIAEVNCKSHVFLGEHRTYTLINWKLRTKTNGVVVEDSERRWANKYLVGLGICYVRVRLPESVGTLADQFTKEPPVPLVWRPAPLWWTIAVHERVVENVWPLVSVVLSELSERGPEP